MSVVNRGEESGRDGKRASVGRNTSEEVVGCRSSSHGMADQVVVTANSFVERVYCAFSSLLK